MNLIFISALKLWILKRRQHEFAFYLVIYLRLKLMFWHRIKISFGFSLWNWNWLNLAHLTWIISLSLMLYFQRGSVWSHTIVPVLCFLNCDFNPRSKNALFISFTNISSCLDLSNILQEFIVDWISWFEFHDFSRLALNFCNIEWKNILISFVPRGDWFSVIKGCIMAHISFSFRVIDELHP